MKECLFYGTILAAVVAGVCVAAPEPAIIQKPGMWTAEARFTQPEQLVLPWGEKGPTRFWYTILTVANRTGRDIEFYPECALMTDTFQIISAGENVPPIVFQQIKQRHQSIYPFLESLDAVDNRILQGEDNAKDIAVIWRDFDARATGFKVFITGLSNETAVVPYPVPAAETGLPELVYLRKTLQLDYTLRGDPAIRYALKTAYKDQRWVMR